MSSLAVQFEQRQSVVTGARCRIGADGAVREWLLFCTPSMAFNVCDDTEYSPSLCVVMEVCRASTALVYELAERGRFYPQIIEFTVEERDETHTTGKKYRHFSVVPSEAVELELFLRVHLPLLEPFFLHWLVVDHWLRLLSILCFVCPRLSTLTLALSFVPPTLRWSPFATTSPSDCAVALFADAVAYAAGLIERMLRTAHFHGERRVRWLWVKLNVTDLCEAEFVKFGILRRDHSLFMPYNGPFGWICQTHVIFDRIGREHWLTIEIVDPRVESTEWTENGMAEEENDGRGEEEDDDQMEESNSDWDDQKSMSDGYGDQVGEGSDCYGSDSNL
ncbi:hypothetical protein niasHT_007028 [Heterodera trifolii]|uniref:Uncharacterized protein n=1 Tax=Heterodera trifolii TaxID=157864 RepID=A0ABD2LXA8_9BILA